MKWQDSCVGERGGAGGDGAGAGGAGGLGELASPPPHAQHISLERKSASSNEPHQEGEPTYPEQLSPYASVAPASVSEQA